MLVPNASVAPSPAYSQSCVGARKYFEGQTISYRRILGQAIYAAFVQVISIKNQGHFT